MLALTLSILSSIPSVPEEPAIVPRPLSLTLREGHFELKPSTRIGYVPEAARPAAEAFAARARRSTGFTLLVEPFKQDDQAPIVFNGSLAVEAQPAGFYVLNANSERVTVMAAGTEGLFYGAQTLLQLLPPEIYSDSVRTDWSLPAVTITDKPRFPWRGLMLDVSRHFMSKDEVKRILDQMALVKLNVFHWHLVDDHGWRIEIKKYPKLTEIGAWRDAIGFDIDPKSSTAYGKDGKYGGFYTQDEIREVVQYAAERCITIVPEIEMPGHSVAALAAYPEYSCTGGPFDRNVPAGVHAGIYCPGNDAVFSFLEDVLTEVFELFPSQVVHLGGDEVPRMVWQKCPKCQERMKSEQLKNVDQLQSWFLKRVEKFVNSKGRRVIGWDEILDGGLAPNAAVMSWRGIDAGLKAANMGHDVVMSPNESLYLDHYQAKSGEPRAIGGFSPIEEVYGYEPLPEGLAPDKLAHLLGLQGNLWTEYVPNAAHAEYMIWPRECAVAETGWSPKERKDLPDFLRRMQVHELRLEELGVHYRPLPPAGLEDALVFGAGSPPKLHVREVFPGGEVRVSFDGSDPAKAAEPLKGSVLLPNSTCKVRVAFAKPDSHDVFSVETLVVMGKARVTTSMSAQGNNELVRAFDLDPRSFFWSDGELKKDDHITLSFFAPLAVKHVNVTTGDTDKPKDTVHRGVLETTSDGKTWTKVADFQEGVADVALTGKILGLRLRATDGQPNWLRVHEFSVE